MLRDSPIHDPDFLRRTLTATAQQMASLAALFATPGIAGGSPADAWRAPLTAAYQQLFASAGAPAMDAGEAGPAAIARWQRATLRFSTLTGAIANDAWARLARALSEDSAGGAPITSLAALHRLWIECGEAAWQAAAHGEDFAEAQAECLAALASLKSQANRR